MQYPVVCILGRRGSGKTCLMTAIAVDEYRATKRRVFANYHIKGIPADIITFAELMDLPEYLTNAIVLLDELQVGADSYETMSKSNKAINTFVTQLRKRKVTLYYTTQVFTQITRRVRLQTNFIFQLNETPTPGITHLQVAEYIPGAPSTIIRDEMLDLREYFKYYDTDEVIHFRDDSKESSKMA